MYRNTAPGGGCNPGNPQRGDPRPPAPSALECALCLAQAVREEQGRRGVEEYVRCLSRLLPQELSRSLSAVLGVPLPPCREEPPPRKDMDMGQLFQLMQLLGGK